MYHHDILHYFAVNVVMTLSLVFQIHLSLPGQGLTFMAFSHPIMVNTCYGIKMFLLKKILGAALSLGLGP